MDEAGLGAVADLVVTGLEKGAIVASKKLRGSLTSSATSHNSEDSTNHDSGFLGISPKRISDARRSSGLRSSAKRGAGLRDSTSSAVSNMIIRNLIESDTHKNNNIDNASAKRKKTVKTPTIVDEVVFPNLDNNNKKRNDDNHDDNTNNYDDYNNIKEQLLLLNNSVHSEVNSHDKHLTGDTSTNDNTNLYHNINIKNINDNHRNSNPQDQLYSEKIVSTPNHATKSSPRNSSLSTDTKPSLKDNFNLILSFKTIEENLQEEIVNEKEDFAIATGDSLESMLAGYHPGIRPTPVVPKSSTRLAPIESKDQEDARDKFHDKDNSIAATTSFISIVPSNSNKCLRTLFQEIIFPICFLIAASIGSYYFTESTGIYALGTLAEEMQKSALEQINERLIGYLDPLRIFLQTGVNMANELELDLSTWGNETVGGLQQLIPYMHHFIYNYFDDSRCCTGIFTNIEYDNNNDGIDDSISCHMLEAPDCYATLTGNINDEIDNRNFTHNALWSGVFHYSETYTADFRARIGDTGSNGHYGDFAQLLPGNINGSPNNTLTFKWYEGNGTMGNGNQWYGDENLNYVGNGPFENCTDRCYEDSHDNHWVEPFGFVHWPIEDGYWYRELQMHNMSKNDVRSSPRVFPWTLYPPAVLKLQLFTPIYDTNDPPNRIGGWVVGFKLHWMSEFLENLQMDNGCMKNSNMLITNHSDFDNYGCFCFIVERATGNLVATSDPRIEVLTNEDTRNGEPILPIQATNSSDRRVSMISEGVLLANNNTWENVHGYLSRSDIEIDVSIIEIGLERIFNRSKPFIMTSDFIRRDVNAPMNSSVKDVPHGIDWIIILSIPEENILRQINERRTSNSWMVVGFSIGLGLAESLFNVFLGVMIGFCMAYYSYYHDYKGATPGGSGESEMSGESRRTSEEPKKFHGVAPHNNENSDNNSKGNGNGNSNTYENRSSSKNNYNCNTNNIISGDNGNNNDNECNDNDANYDDVKINNGDNARENINNVNGMDVVVIDFDDNNSIDSDHINDTKNNDKNTNRRCKRFGTVVGKKKYVPLQ